MAEEEVPGPETASPVSAEAAVAHGAASAISSCAASGLMHSAATVVWAALLGHAEGALHRG